MKQTELSVAILIIFHLPPINICTHGIVWHLYSSVQLLEHCNFHCFLIIGTMNMCLLRYCSSTHKGTHTYIQFVCPKSPLNFSFLFISKHMSLYSNKHMVTPPSSVLMAQIIVPVFWYYGTPGVCFLGFMQHYIVTHVNYNNKYICVEANVSQWWYDLLFDY